MILLVGIAIFPVLLVYIYFLSRNVLFGWISLLTIYFVEFSFGITQYDVAGINLDVVDIVQICLLLAGVIRTIPLLRERNTGRKIAIAYFCVFTFSLIRGIATHGIAHAGNGSRLFVGLLIALLYFLTAPVDPDSVMQYLRVYMYYGVGLMFVACLAFAGAPIGGVAWAHNDPVKLELMEGRVLPSHCALTLVFCFFFSLAESRYRNTTAFRKWLPAMFLGLAVFLRHRSVWAVIAVGTVSFLFVDRKLVRRLVPITAIALFTILGYALLSGAAVNLIRDQLSKSATNNETWLFRLGMWQALLGGEHTIVSTLLGKDLGGGYMVFDLNYGHYVNVPPHNDYVTQYLSLGLVGVALLLWFTFRPLRRFWRLSSIDMTAVMPSASAWVAVIIGTVAFSIPYQPRADAYALLAIANAIVFRLDEEARVRNNEASANWIPPIVDDSRLLGSHTTL